MGIVNTDSVLFNNINEIINDSTEIGIRFDYFLSIFILYLKTNNKDTYYFNTYEFFDSLYNDREVVSSDVVRLDEVNDIKFIKYSKFGMEILNLLISPDEEIQQLGEKLFNDLYEQHNIWTRST